MRDDPYIKGALTDFSVDYLNKSITWLIPDDDKTKSVGTPAEGFFPSVTYQAMYSYFAEDWSNA